MKKLIEKIREMKGVVTVEPAGEDMAVVVFEPKDERELRKWMEIEFKKPKMLKAEELVDGEIYVAEECDANFLFRFKSIRNIFPTHILANCYFATGGLYDYLCINSKHVTVRHATTSEKQTLIKEEVKNGYFHELNK